MTAFEANADFRWTIVDVVILHEDYRDIIVHLL